MLQILFVLMILFAVYAVQTSKLRRAIIYLGVFSLMSSFCYLLFSAPDVAMAEAVIGSTLATILFLVAFQQHKVFTIYYTNEDFENIDDNYISKGKIQILRVIEKFWISEELEPQAIYTTEKLQHILNNYEFDLIVRQKGKCISIYGNKQNYKLEYLYEYINMNKNLKSECTVYDVMESVDE